MYVENNGCKICSFSENFEYNNFGYTENDIKNIPNEDNLVVSIEIKEDSTFNFFEWLINIITGRNAQKEDPLFNAFCGEKREKFGNTDDKSIAVFGCSYAYGHGLKKEESFPFLLAENTGTTVYNYAACGGELLSSLDGYFDYYRDNEEAEPVNTVVYLYMYDHINRFLQTDLLYRFYDDLFDIREDGLHSFLLHRFALYKYICVSYQMRKLTKDLPVTENIELFLKKVVSISYQKIKEYSPEAKLIIVLYNEKFPNDKSYFEIIFADSIINSKIWDELEEETNGNIQIVRTKDVMGFYFHKDYKLKYDLTDWHPNAHAWKEFTPKFVEKYLK